MSSKKVAMDHLSVRVFAAVVIALASVAVIGYVSLTSYAQTLGLLLGSSGEPESATAPRFPWELHVALGIVIAIVMYLIRQYFSSRSCKIALLAVFAAATIVGWIYAVSLPKFNMGYAMELLTSAGSSPALVALIAFTAISPWSTKLRTTTEDDAPIMTEIEIAGSK